MLWTVQQFEHELGNTSPEEVLRRALSEIRPTDSSTKNNPEIFKYNETVRIVKTRFPDFGEPRIMLLHRPHNAKMSQLPSISTGELKKEYRNQITQLQTLIRERLRPKQFASYLPPEENNGKFVANLVEKIVDRMNDIESAYVGATLVKHLSEQLHKRTFNLYLSAMNVRAPLPQDEEDLKRVHSEEMTKHLSMFKVRCAGGLDKFGNIEIYQSLTTAIENWFESQLSNNTFVARVYCSEQANRIFEKVWSTESDDYTVDTFDRDLERMTRQYQTVVRGPKSIKERTLNDILVKLHVKRLNLLHQEAKQDFSSMTILCVMIFIAAYGLYYIMSMAPDVFSVLLFRLLIALKLASMSMFVWLFIIHLNMVQVANDSWFSFTSLQLFYRATRKYFTLALVASTMAAIVLARFYRSWFAQEQAPKRKPSTTTEELVQMLTTFFKKQGILSSERRVSSESDDGRMHFDEASSDHDPSSWQTPSIMREGSDRGIFISSKLIHSLKKNKKKLSTPKSEVKHKLPGSITLRSRQRRAVSYDAMPGF